MKPHFGLFNATTDRMISYHESYEGENGAKTHAIKHAMNFPSHEFVVMTPLIRVKKVDVELKAYSREGVPEL